MAHLQTEFISHTRKVCSLYKRILRNMESYCYHKVEFRYQAVVMRDTFDQKKDIKDLVVANELLRNGEAELARRMHPRPKKFAFSPGGVAYGREERIPDWVLDHWTPWEKAQYPEYFALREKRKKDFIPFYESDFGRKNVQSEK